jgi:FtsH-binding integral membrane protein
MSHYGVEHGMGVTAADAPEALRLEFIRKTYAHLGGAVLAFAGLEAMLFKSGYADDLTVTMLGSRGSWAIVLGAFLVVGWIADYWARHTTSKPMQYLGLLLYVAAEVIIFCPLLFIAEAYDAELLTQGTESHIIRDAGIITAIIFGGLTAAVFITKKDFSFLRGALYTAGFAAMGLIVMSLIFGFTLGLVFSVAMVVLAAGYILYYTSNVLHHYPVGAHVAAALALFSAVALMFWYVIRILMDRR